MITWICATAWVVVFSICLYLLKLVPLFNKIIASTGKYFDIISDSDLNDLDKEKQLQASALSIFGKFLLLLMGSVACFVFPLVGLWGMERAGWIRLNDVFSLILSWPFITVTIILIIPVWVLIKHGQVRDPKRRAFENRYNLLDQTLHKLAFRIIPIQISLSNTEDRLFRKSMLSGELMEYPLFIASLPRAGTTLLLDLLYETGEFATHTYRHMPFLFIPFFWHQLSQRFINYDTPRERAHGDGMMVNVDSPEAFEEIIWKAFWKKHYSRDRIFPWAGKKVAADFDIFFRSHIRKIISIAQGKDGTPKRYLSKNNLNIARTSYLKTLFPGATIITPVRHPLRQAVSLLRQHENFLSIHEQDPFACCYMKDIGHLDFGRNLRPVDFSRWIEKNPDLRPERLEFWLKYWLETYSYLMKKDNDLIFFDYDYFCENSLEGAVFLGRVAGIRDLTKLQQLAERVTVRERLPLPNLPADSPIFQECLNLYGLLQRHCVNN